MKSGKAQSVVSFVLDNLVDLITISVAAFLIVRNEVSPFGINDFNKLATWILGVLGLIAISGLWERNRRLTRIEKMLHGNHDLVLKHFSGKNRACDFFMSGSNLSIDDLSSATSIFFSGVTLSGTTKEYAYILGKRLVAGATIRFVVIDPVDSVLEELISRSWADATQAYYKDRIKTVESLIDYISRTPDAKGKVELGYLPYHPSFGLTLIDPDQPRGLCYVELYQHKSADPNPSFRIQASEDPIWFDFFYKQSKILWDSCRVVKLPSEEGG